MLTLAKDLRKKLSDVTLDARARAETAARAALENAAVHERQARGHMDQAQKELRTKLRARGKALGDARNPDGTQSVGHLAEAAAYEQWHRLLFTRFLADNHLLRTDAENGNVPISLQECDELALELGARDGFDLACRFAAKALPGVFRGDDPVLALRLSLNDEVELKRLLDSLPPNVFTATDSLGWTYQFWQDRRKKEVNESGKKIGADELAAVTQLFTEDYMVEFLLHNTLGAWWAGKLGPIHAANEEEARAQASLPVKDGLGIIWTYLRFVEDQQTKAWSPAAGTFPGWPSQAKLITFLDPCMGSGHFLVFALPLLARMRMDEERLSAAQAVHATLHDNLFGLELDERCAQIGAFNLALTAWKLGGYQSLPQLHLACSGVGPHALENDWVSLSAGDDRLRRGMGRLYALFKDAPLLGSLINPHVMGGDLIEAEFHELQPLLERALAQEAENNTAHEMAVTAQGLAKAAEILTGRFVLIATNVPYLGRGKQDDVLKEYCERVHPEAKADLATCFVERCQSFCVPGATIALVTPQNWWFLGTYKAIRRNFMNEAALNFIVTLGEEAWQTFGDRGPVAALMIAQSHRPTRGHAMAAIDALPEGTIAEKVSLMRDGAVRLLSQLGQYGNPDHRITIDPPVSGPLLQVCADSLQGVSPADFPHYGRTFWEVSGGKEWKFWQSTVEETTLYGGQSLLLWWNEDLLQAVDGGRAFIRGEAAWGKRGVAVRQMRNLSCTLYTGEVFDTNTAVIVPSQQSQLPALWVFCSSSDFRDSVRRIDKKVNVTNASLLKVPFDPVYWEKVAAKQYPEGLSRPFSSDPMQWLFNGHPKGSDQPLHVAVARLLGYLWPRQTGSSLPDCTTVAPDRLEQHADSDGISCLSAINKEEPAAVRLRALLSAALGGFDERALITSAGLKGGQSPSLEAWLRDEFFEQHVKLFHNRPFIWHIWDGRLDGFHALVNYHRLDHATLQKLTYSYLGDWIRQQERDAKSDISGAADRLGAARQLQAELANIIEGEPPYDIFVRWKALSQQAVGWHPDTRDGVRLNIRPFLSSTDIGKKGSGLLRSKPNIGWEKDRGTELHRDKLEYPWFWCGEEPGTESEAGQRVHRESLE